MTTIAPAAGDNRPPLKDQLEIRHQELLDRVKELLTAYDRVPAKVSDDITMGKVSDFYKMLQAALKRGEALRTDEKEPFLMGGREVDSFFSERVKAPIERAMNELKKRSDTYLRLKAEEERRRREEEAAKARAEEQAKLEAARKAEEANRPKAAEKKLTEAVVAAHVAETAEAAAAAPISELAATRGDHSLATMSRFWDFEVTDWDAVDPREFFAFISLDDLQKAIRAFVRVHKGSKHLAGVRIFENSRSNFR